MNKNTMLNRNYNSMKVTAKLIHAIYMNTISIPQEITQWSTVYIYCDTENLQSKTVSAEVQTKNKYIHYA